jgi:hypothetical protein
MKFRKKSLREVSLDEPHTISDGAKIHREYGTKDSRLASCVDRVALGNWDSLIITPAMHCKSTVHFSHRAPRLELHSEKMCQCSPADLAALGFAISLLTSAIVAFMTTTIMASVLSPLDSLTVSPPANRKISAHQPFQHPAPIWERHDLLMQSLKDPPDLYGRVCHCWS